MATYWLKIAHFSYPSLIWRPPLPTFPSEFRREIDHEETRVMGLQTDRQTDGRAIAYSALYHVLGVPKNGTPVLILR